MTGTLNLPGGNTLWLEEAAKSIRLQPVLGGARFELTVKTWANQAAPEGQHKLSATLLVGTSPNQNLHELGKVHADRLVPVSPSPTQLTFTGYVSADALREVEEVRKGDPLWVVLRGLRGTSVGENGLTETTGSDFTTEIFSEEWGKQLERVTAASYVEILVPVSEDTAMATAAGRLRTARGYIRDGHTNAAAAELRQALDPVRNAYDTKKMVQSIRDKKARDRTVLERWILTVEDTYSLLSAFIHDDEEAIEGAVLDRAQAVSLMGDVAGKVHRLAADRKAGLI